MSPSKHRLALVTGASSGLGEALALRLASEGWEVVAVARRQALLADLAQQHPGRIHPLVADLATEEGLAQVVAFVGDRPLGLLVNNAGFGEFGPHEGQSAEALRRLLLVNVVAVAELCRALAPALLQARGQVLNVASVLAFQPAPGFAAYGASKAFVQHFSEALWAEWAGRIRVVNLCPAGFASGFGQGGESQALNSTRAMAQIAPLAGVVEAAMRALDQRSPTHFDGWRAWGLSLAARAMPRAWVARLGAFMFRPRTPWGSGPTAVGPA